MSVLVKGIEMPQEGKVIVIDCTGQVWSNEWPTRGYTRLKNAKAINVPPHGRLIDAEALYCRLVNEPIRAVDGVPFDADWWTRVADAYGQAIDAVEQAPTIIEAEGEGENV